MLTGKARIGQVLGRGRAAHGDRCLVEFATPVQFSVGGANLVRQIVGEDAPRDRGTDRLAHLGERGAGVEAGELRLHQRFERIVREKATVRVGRDRESTGYANARAAEIADHLAKRGGLPADDRHIIARNVFEPPEHDTSNQGTAEVFAIRAVPIERAFPDRRRGRDVHGSLAWGAPRGQLYSRPVRSQPQSIRFLSRVPCVSCLS